MWERKYTDNNAENLQKKIQIHNIFTKLIANIM